MAKARRLPSCPLRCPVRRAPLAVCLWLGAFVAGVAAEPLAEARFVAPTDRYGHGVLGDAIEFGGLELRSGAGWVRFDLPRDHVFEDLAPRLVDLDLDGAADAAMVVETDMRRGAALVLYGAGGKIAETPHIGRSNRWLAPIGAADLDGDGRVELAYIDRPHLAKTLRIWRYADGDVTEVAAVSGLTNHRIGEDFISGGIRICGAIAEIITVDADWRNVIATRFKDGEIHSRIISPFTGPADIKTAMDCP